MISKLVAAIAKAAALLHPIAVNRIMKDVAIALFA
jgi:hypothetical protein